MEPSRQHAKHGWVAPAQLPGDLIGAALGLQDPPHFSFGDPSPGDSLAWTEPTTMAWRLTVMKGPPVTTVAAFKPSSLHAIATETSA
jgi:hypothetical protein